MNMWDFCGISRVENGYVIEGKEPVDGKMKSTVYVMQHINEMLDIIRRNMAEQQQAGQQGAPANQQQLVGHEQQGE